MKKEVQRLCGGLLAVGMLAAAAPLSLAASDLDGHWAKGAMESLVDGGYLNGYGDGNYGPDDALTGAQFTAILERASGLPESGGGEDQAITRQQAMVQLAQALELAGGDESALDRFADKDAVDADARASVAALVAAGYVQGSDTGLLLPGQTLTRAQGAVLVSNVLDALTPAVPAEGTVYGTATLTYAEFYSGDVSTTDGYGVDGVTSATTSKYSIMSNMSTDFQSEEANANGYHILGVQNVNVAVDAADYQAYKALNPTFRVSRSTPEQYKEVTIQDGKAVYSETKFNTKDTVTDAGYTLKTGSTWGDYEIDLAETSTQYVRNSREDTFAVNSAIQGVILETSDGQKVGMEYLQSIWVQPYEVSFNVSADSARNAHISAWDNLAELSKLEGKTVTSMTYIMQNETYVYQFADGIYLKPAYTGDEVVSAAFTQGSNQVALANIPAALENVTVTITCGSGRAAVTVADAVSVTDGVVTMSEAYDSAQSYTVKVSSSNYADLAVSVPAP
jgi:hypothetical protein